MKKVISMLVAVMLISMAGLSQKLTTSKVPPVVRKAFSKEFPRAAQVAWSMADSNYKVTFTIDRVMNATVYNKDAKWLEKEVSIKASDVPKEVKAALKAEFKGFKATEAEKIMLPDNTLQYRMGISKKDELYEVRFSQTGEVLNKEVKTAPVVKGKK